MRATTRASSAVLSCLTTFTNQCSRPHQRDERKAEPLNRVRQVRAVVERRWRPAARQSPLWWGLRRFELNDERKNAPPPCHVDVATAARRNQGNARHCRGIRLPIARMVDME